MRVVPKKAQRRADKRTAEHRQLANLGDVLNVQVGGPAEVAADVGQHRQGACGDNRAADGEAVQPSVRFTAFDEPTITKPTKTRKGINAKGQKCFEFINEWITRSGWTRFRNGIINWVEYALWVVRTRSAAPTTRLMNT